MESASLNLMDHYEQQLYTVFKTFDIANEEALDRAAVLDLCNALQLDDRSHSLVQGLFDHTADKVTFAQFRNGLLTVLGADCPPSGAAPGPAHSDDDSSGREVAPKYVCGSKKYGRRSRPQTVLSPPSLEATPDMSCSLTSSENDKKRKGLLKCKKTLILEDPKDKIMYSEDIASGQGQLDHDRFVDYEESIALCKSLHMDGIDREIVRQIFTQRSCLENNNKITIGEFFHHLNNSLTMSLTSCHDVMVLPNEIILNPSSDVNTSNGTIEAKKVLEAWEHAGIDHGPRLLHELGFTGPALHITDLSNALDEELRVLSTQHSPSPNDARTLLLQSSLALHRFQYIRINNIMEQVFIENNKLKNDLTDANNRAQVLAQEVDENHARMETSLKNKMKQMESKHAESIKLLTEEWTSEKEKTLLVISELEQQNKRLLAEDMQHKSESVLLSAENEELRKKLSQKDDRLSELEAIRTSLSNEIKILSSEIKDYKVGNEEQNSLNELVSRLDDLQLQNKMLRDRNDELCAEVDSLTNNVSKDGQKHSQVASTPLSLDFAHDKMSPWSDESDGLKSGDRASKRRGDSPSSGLARLSDDESPRVGKLRRRLVNNQDEIDSSILGLEGNNSYDTTTSFTTVHLGYHTQDCDSSLISLDQGFIGHLEIMGKLQEILMSTQNVSKDVFACESCNNLKAIIAVIQKKIDEMTTCVVYSEQPVNDQSVNVETYTVSIQTEVDDEEKELRDKLISSEKLHQEEKSKLEILVKELDISLVHMKQEYEKCEEYWSKKLEMERDDFSEEQRLSDERLNELILKIHEYEEQFAPKSQNSTLPTIDEKYSLELQFTDLEEEFDKYRKEMDLQLKAKVDEIDELKEKLKSLEEKSLTNGFQSPHLDKRNGSSSGSPIGYLWSQGTIHTPYSKVNNKRHSVRDYHNPAFAQSSQSPKCEETVRCSSDGEKDKVQLNPIQRPGLALRSSSAGALRDEEPERDKTPTMIHCAELEGQLRRQQLQSTVSSTTCHSCSILEHRCRQLYANLRHHQLHLESVQHSARNESVSLRARLSSAETAVARLQERLAAADTLVKDLYLENCHLAHHQRPLL